MRLSQFEMSEYFAQFYAIAFDLVIKLDQIMFLIIIIGRLLMAQKFAAD